jgi:transcriptional regulator with GAF, ATPase, and Fis domain
MKKYHWLNQMEANNKYVVLLMALIPHPLSLDDLIAVESIKVSQALEVIGILEEKGLISVLKPMGKGYYSFVDPDFIQWVVDNCSPQELNRAALKLIPFFEREYEEGEKKDLAIARLYLLSGLSIQSPERLLRAAGYMIRSGLRDKALPYYQLLITFLKKNRHRPKSKELFIDAVLGLIHVQGHLMPLGEQKHLLEDAIHNARKINDPPRSARLHLIYAQILQTMGYYDKAGRFFEEGWRIVQDLKSSELIKWAAIYTTDFLFWQGKVAEVIERYEQVIGNLEEFSSDEATLKACACLGWCYGINGQTARGVGLIEAVRGRAREFGLEEVKTYADLMTVLTLLEARRLPEAQVYLSRILSHSPERLGHYILWAAKAATAFIQYNHGDLKGCFRSQTEAYEHAKKFGRLHHRGPWNFEYLDALEKSGMVHPEMNFQSEITRFLAWPDIYMQGVALRYRAQRGLENDSPFSEIYDDLKRSQKLLTKAGAILELSRTQILTARLLLKERRGKEAKELLERAWKVLSEANQDIFPDDLRRYLEEEDRGKTLSRIMVEVGNTLGTIREENELLKRIINLIMRLVRAERGGFFLVDDKGDLELGVSRNLDLGMVFNSQFIENYRVMKKVAHTGQEILMTGDIRKTRDNSKPTDVGWIFCFPVILQDRLLGVLYLDCTLIAQPFPERDIPVLKAIGNQMAVAIDNARAYEEIALLKDRLEEKTKIYRLDQPPPPSLQEIIGKTEAIQSVIRQIQKVAQTDSSVLITGETGVGKGLVARAIHQVSQRKDGPFISVNTASLAPSLIASELFGHERGAFTGAIQRHIGRFELADGGTFFLDDLDVLSLEIQSKILRILQEKELERVGGTKTIRSDFRLITATNQSLRKMIKEGRFRSDLYYRLNVFPIHIPPLRERKDDIPLLAMHFLGLYRTKMGKKVEGISESQMAQLVEYDWPGNVRELRHIIERAVIMSEGPSLRLPSLKEFTPTENITKEHLTWEEMERSYLVKILEICSGRVSGDKGAAKVLNLKPATLYSKIRRLGITRKMALEEDLNKMDRLLT